MVYDVGMEMSATAKMDRLDVLLNELDDALASGEYDRHAELLEEADALHAEITAMVAAA